MRSSQSSSVRVGYDVGRATCVTGIGQTNTEGKFQTDRLSPDRRVTKREQSEGGTEGDPWGYGNKEIL